MKKLTVVACALFVFFVVADLRAWTPTGLYGAPVNEFTYADPMSEMIEKGGYDWVDDAITEAHFPAEKSEGMVASTVELIHLNRATGSAEAVKELDRMGYRPATLRELLAVGAKYSEKQLGVHVVALGSGWRSPRGYWYVTYIAEYGTDHYLLIRDQHGKWPETFRFAAVRKS